ncbi:MAG: metallophosphoesterase [Oscillospiraceae bacterium]
MANFNKLFALGGVLAAGIALKNNFFFGTDEYSAEFSTLPEDFDGFKILQLSDLHGKIFGRNNNSLVDKIVKISPDIIVLTGDMISRSGNADSFLQLARRLSVKFKVFYTIGNHELDIDETYLAKVFAILRSFGITILNNEKILLRNGNSQVALYGMWYASHFYKDDTGDYSRHTEFDLGEMKRLLGERNSDEFSILLAHNPLSFPIYAKWGADLTFSGHIHGGVVALPVLGGLLSPGRNFFPRYFRGIYKKFGKTLITSRGIGGIRFNVPPTITVAVLKCTK